MSLAVALIGIFGIMVLIPVAARLAETGLDLDEAGAVGRRGLNEFEVRGMRNPTFWRAMDPGTSNFGGIVPQPNESYCIDPEYVARNATALSPANFNSYAAWFPINSSATINAPMPNQPLYKTPLPTMRRITLGTGSAVAPLMSEAMARQIFSSQDDLQFEEPEDKTNPPRQVYHNEEIVGLPNAVKRQSLGDKSWIAILTPRPSPTGLPEGDLYTLYIVVYKERDLNITAQIDSVSGTLKGDAERWCRLDFTSPGAGQGLGGGGVYMRPTVQPTDANMGFGDARDLEVDRDQWMLVTQRVTAQNIPNGYTSPGGNYLEVFDIFRWYRVSDVNEIDPTIPQRFISLDGPDWVTPANTTSTDGSVTFGPVYGVTCTGVLEVYERTVRLESQSIWSN